MASQSYLLELLWLSNHVARAPHGRRGSLQAVQDVGCERLMHAIRGCCLLSAAE